MKKGGVYFLVLAISIILISCTSNNNIIKEERRIKDTTSYKSEDIESINKIEDFIKEQEQYIIEKNKEKYMETLSKDEEEYYWEKIHWFDDIISSDIEGYSLEVLKVEKVDDLKFRAELLQKYHCNEKDYSLKYANIYRIKDNKILDYDLDFKTFETEHFIIKYLGKLQLKEWLCEQVEKGYNIATGNYGQTLKDKTIIKLYDDRELLRQSVKLSFGWQFGGWYEYPESIKFLKLKNFTDYFKRGIAHELIHKLTIEEAANNMPYWLAEGLAEHFSKEEGIGDRYQPSYELIELEKIDLENYEGNIYDYYESSRFYVERMIEAYGIEKVKEILKELSEYGFQEKTNGEIYLENNKKFHEVIQKVLGTTFEEMNAEFSVDQI
ncbi:hypothetical protein [Oceanirhabdus sp. W0125-5]|uniref:hypothetical protein n=1 Tax=Oceanirhabdus sp. W0125-5 TaxID=2999116 RepID=UPI0022F2BAFA|nr:hypothetical protein [Oceanirhabdus sp. W0125-5]WBW98124.1 hypothetical protein OW730_04990 [Oceanirhabdus sp. W0125-5]